jgi:arsenite methyltransferase
MGTPRFVARQLSRPHGLFGRVIVRLMNRHNANINAFALHQLALTPDDRVLEIGFGGGPLLERIVDSSAFVGGLDRSTYAVQRARARLKSAVRDGRAEFREGNVESIPFATASFTKICTVNTIYFWKSLDAGFAEIRRVLRPGGRIAIGFVTKEKMDRMGLPGDIFTSREPDEVVAALRSNGFNDVRLERPKPTTPWVIAVAS